DPQKVLDGERQIESFALTPNGKRAVFTAVWPNRPWELYTADLANGRRETNLSHANDGFLAQVDLGAIRRTTCKAPDGLTIESFVIYPPGYKRGRRYPLAVNVHGGPHSYHPGSRALTEFHALAARGYVVLLPNPRGSTGYGEAFTEMVVADWAGGDYGDRFFFPFSFGPFIGFWAAFEAAAELGNFCLPAGGMTTTARLEYMLDHAATVVCCTPTYALRMAEVADREGIDLRSSSVRLLIVAGEPGGSIPAVRSRIEEDWCARVIDHVGMTEIGAYGFECVEAPGGLHVIESEFVAEVIDPTTCEVLPDGRVGELVLTNLGRRGSPLIRYRTGDQVLLTRDRCRCGRWFARIEGGIRGRLDDMLIIRGNNVFPSAIEGLLREYREVSEFRLVVDRAGSMADLHIEVEPDPERDAGDLAHRIETSVRDRFHFKPRVTLVSAGSLPRFEMKARRLIRNDR
ncbi:MAG: prolyl oligopeptidase family serine peptidase, partial [Planctomycetes bacterium]|nr:prolyl oligopeptidase family serine peptidase [Planctomycetota bacterium]